MCGSGYKPAGEGGGENSGGAAKCKVYSDAPILLVATKNRVMGYGLNENTQLSGKVQAIEPMGGTAITSIDFHYEVGG